MELGFEGWAGRKGEIGNFSTSLPTCLLVYTVLQIPFAQFVFYSPSLFGPFFFSVPISHVSHNVVVYNLSVMLASRHCTLIYIHTQSRILDLALVFSAITAIGK